MKWDSYSNYESQKLCGTAFYTLPIRPETIVFMQLWEEGGERRSEADLFISRYNSMTLGNCHWKNRLQPEGLEFKH